MRAKKDPKTGKWYIRFRYTDWQGKRRETMKRGFETKHDAEEWLRTFLSQQKADLNITFADYRDVFQGYLTAPAREYAAHQALHSRSESNAVFRCEEDQ